MKTLETLYEKNDKGFCIKAPAVGYASHLPLQRQLLMAGSDVGRLQILGTVYRLLLPDFLAGRVEQVDRELTHKAVAYDEPLFVLSTGQVDWLSSGEPQSQKSSRRVKLMGKCMISAPTDGVFYRRSAPDQPAYVEVGDSVKIGQVLGLVEVMKCFNQITYTGDGVSCEVKVLEICVNDGCEVKYQQPLFMLG